jgi:hypothetical protein
MYVGRHSVLVTLNLLFIDDNLSHEYSHVYNRVKCVYMLADYRNYNAYIMQWPIQIVSPILT